MLGNTFHNVKRPERDFNHFFKQMHKNLKCTVSAMGYSTSFVKIIVESLLYFMEIYFDVHFRTVKLLGINQAGLTQLIQGIKINSSLYHAFITHFVSSPIEHKTYDYFQRKICSISFFRIYI